MTDRDKPVFGNDPTEAGSTPAEDASGASSERDGPGEFEKGPGTRKSSGTGTPMAGQSFSHYQVLEKLGEGGMGVVYKARDLRLDRPVALKFLGTPHGAQPEEEERFVREARAASALDHPNICAIHEIDRTPSGQLYIVMTHYDGETLQRKIERGPLKVDEAAGIAEQIARGLARAHAQDIVHRDIKPANVIVLGDGVVKIVDFGLAKLRGSKNLTATGWKMGTLAYMSPEQTRGEAVDHRTDLWSLGVVLYEMLAGRHPFPAENQASLVYHIVHHAPEPLKKIVRDLPPELEAILARTLEKDPESRYVSAEELSTDLGAFRSRLAAPDELPANLSLLWKSLRRPRFVISAVLVLVALALGGFWLAHRSDRVTWARREALPAIERLADEEDFPRAFRLARQAERYVPGDARLAELWPRIAREISVETTPPGAEVFIREYAAVDIEWQRLGRSPISGLRIPRGFFHWRVTKEGFDTVEGARGRRSGNLEFTLDRKGTVPPGMVRVPGGEFNVSTTGLDHLRGISLGAYFIDRHEVTNKEFARFVESGGYRKREYWKHEFVEDGQVLSWEEAMGKFHDATGRPGPASWEVGRYATGQGDFPVTGVNWYEAAAYAEFAGKALPTLYDWNMAAWPGDSPHVLPLSNFGSGPSGVGEHRGMNRYGTYDMAGNVKEWCWNRSGKDGNQRYILGGAWSEPSYMFNDPDAQAPIGRLPTYGFRCVKYLSSDGVPETLAAAIERPSRDYAAEKPVSDEFFRIYQRFYAYDKADLNSVVQSVDKTSPDWRKEQVSFDAAYGGERVNAYVFLPRSVEPPYQAVVYFPGSGALRRRSSEKLPDIGFLVRSGRALMYPIYKSTYERGDGLLTDRPKITNLFRDHVVQWCKDVARSIDYLETRADIDSDKLAYYGVSWGATMGAIVPAVERRIKVSVLVVGGFWLQRGPPEVEQINFAPRVKIPVLMLNGRYDHIFPVETSQAPMFRHLGTPEGDKDHLLFDSGHSIPRQAGIKESLDWLDRYLGPVQ